MAGYLLIGLTSGLIAASITSYKDAPWENFLWKKFIRSIIVGGMVGIALFFLNMQGIFTVHNPGLLLLIIFPIERLIGETYKGFFRRTTHAEFKYLFINYHIPYERFAVKMTAGALFLVAATLLLALSIHLSGVLLDSSLQPIYSGALVGLMAGTLIAIGGGLKDSQFEGFQIRKFFRSPLAGMAAGVILIAFTSHPAILLLSAMGLERITVEFYKTYYTRKVRGIFEGQKPKYEAWLKKRWVLFVSYCLGVAIMLVLLLMNRV